MCKEGTMGIPVGNTNINKIWFLFSRSLKLSEKDRI